MVVGAGDGDLARLERLTQRIEHLGLEFRQLVEEQHAVVCQRDLARLGPPTSAGIEAEWCGAQNGRRSVSAPSSISPATEAIIDTSSSSAGVSGGRMVGSRAAGIDLPWAESITSAL
jgi:hypothetical protein